MTLAVEQAGNGIPLVFLHAFPMDRRMWAPQASFSRHYRMITLLGIPVGTLIVVWTALGLLLTVRYIIGRRRER